MLRGVRGGFPQTLEPLPSSVEGPRRNHSSGTLVTDQEILLRSIVLLGTRQFV